MLNIIFYIVIILQTTVIDNLKI